MNRCPSNFVLDDFELHGTATAAEAEHFRTCRRCADRSGTRATAISHFDGALAGSVWRGVLDRRAALKRRRRFWLAVPLVTVGFGVAALLLVVLPTVSPFHGAPYLAPKGEALAEVVCRRDGRTFALAPGDAVRPDDELRFRPLPAWGAARFIHIGSVDGTWRYTSFYPTAGWPGAKGLALPARSDALPGSIRLDHAPGPERVLVLLSPTALSIDDVRRAAEAAAPGGRAIDRVGDTAVVGRWMVFPKRDDAKLVDQRQRTP